MNFQSQKRCSVETFYQFSAFFKRNVTSVVSEIFENKLYLFTRIISQAFRKYIVLSGYCKRIKSYLADRWFEHITLLK